MKPVYKIGTIILFEQLILLFRYMNHLLINTDFVLLKIINLSLYLYNIIIMENVQLQSMKN